MRVVTCFFLQEGCIPQAIAWDLEEPRLLAVHAVVSHTVLSHAVVNQTVGKTTHPW